jgi:hypothetical protein
MTENLTLAQQHLYTFEVCQRRFYLRFLARLPWPEAPLGPEQELAYERGRRFHRWIERYLLGLPVTGPDADPVLGNWWATFRQYAPALPDGRRYVETSLTVPIGESGHRLTGRFDLLIVDGERPAAMLFDWKTGEPRTPERLRRAWQTRVYLVALAAGGAALAPDSPSAFDPDQLSLTYWYVEDPTQPRILAYDQTAYQRDRAEIETVVAAIDRQLTVNEWPLTEDWNECRHCAYQAYCGRQAAGQGPLDAGEDGEAEDEVEAAEDNDWLETQWG